MIHALCALLLAVEPVQVPHDPGLYYLGAEGLARIEGHPVTVEHGRNRVPLGGSLPMGNRVRAEILGDHAQRQVTATPVFYYRVEPGQEAIGAADLVLVRLSAKSDHREFNLSSEADWQSSAGIPLKAQVKFYTKEAQDGVYRLVPAEDLSPGEYGFYLFRGRDMPGLIFDFAVAGNAPSQGHRGRVHLHKLW